MANKLIPEEVKEIIVRKGMFDKLTEVSRIDGICEVIDMSNKVIAKSAYLDENLIEGSLYYLEIVQFMRDTNDGKSIAKSRDRRGMRLKKIEIKTNNTPFNVTYIFEKENYSYATKVDEKAKEKEAINNLVGLVVEMLREELRNKPIV